MEEQKQEPIKRLKSEVKLQMVPCIFFRCKHCEQKHQVPQPDLVQGLVAGHEAELDCPTCRKPITLYMSRILKGLPTHQLPPQKVPQILTK